MTRQKLQFRYAVLSLAVAAMLTLPTGCSSLPSPFVTPLPTSTVTLTSTPPTQTPTSTPTAAPTPLGGGSLMVFSQERGGDNDIYVMNVNGSGLTDLTNSPGYDGEPRWSPDGTKIAFVSKRSGNFDIYVMNADGSGLKKLTKHPTSIYGLDVSPDGTKIVYDAGSSDSMFSQDHVDIYVMNADGSGMKNLTNDAPDDIWPRWSRDGTKISFVSTRSGDREKGSGVFNRENYIMNSDGSNVVLLLKDTNATRGQATWSPDGTKIAMIGGRNGSLSIYVLNANNTGSIHAIPLPNYFEGYGSVDWSLH